MAMSNPALNTNTFANFRDRLSQTAADRENHMSIQGTVNKTGFLLIVVAAAYAFVWNLALNNGPAAAYPFMLGGMIGGTLVAFLTIFKKNLVPYTAPIYAALEGLFLGGLSYYLDAQFPGIPFWAVIATFGTLFSMLALYKFRVIKVTERFKSTIAAAMMGILLLYVAQMVLGFFGTGIPLLFSNGIVGIGVSIVIVGVAAFRLVLDFHFIEEGAKAEAPKFMEWYGAFGLVMGLVWLYMELLRLFSLISSRD